MDFLDILWKFQNEKVKYSFDYDLKFVKTIPSPETKIDASKEAKSSKHTKQLLGSNDVDWDSMLDVEEIAEQQALNYSSKQ